MSAEPVLDLDRIFVRLAETPEEIAQAQRLRYSVFYEEYGAKPSPEMAETSRDFDHYDNFADHLIVIDETLGKDEKAIVGTYRLLRQDQADKAGQFYSSDEFNLTPFLESGMSLLELGRSCVLPDYRTRSVLQLLWQGIADYITQHNIDLMFGCASLHGTSVDDLATPLSYLHHFHPSPEDLRPKAVDGRYVDMNLIPKDQIDARRAFSALPPIIKGYLRIGGTIGDGAVVDEQFNTTDVCIVMQTGLLTQRYRKHYERKMRREMPKSKENA